MLRKHTAYLTGALPQTMALSFGFSNKTSAHSKSIEKYFLSTETRLSHSDSASPMQKWAWPWLWSPRAPRTGATPFPPFLFFTPWMHPAFPYTPEKLREDLNCPSRHTWPPADGPHREGRKGLHLFSFGLFPPFMQITTCREIMHRACTLWI